MKKIIHISSLLIASIICSGCASSSYETSMPREPQGPKWPKGNAKGIDNVFDDIIYYARMSENDNLTTLQKYEYSFSKLIGKEIYITTKVDDVNISRISGWDKNESWKPDSYQLGLILMNPIRYDFEFDYNSDADSFSSIRIGDTVNIKGKVKNITKKTYGARGGNGYSNALTITIESCEFFN